MPAEMQLDWEKSKIADVHFWVFLVAHLEKQKLAFAIRRIDYTEYLE